MSTQIQLGKNAKLGLKVNTTWGTEAAVTKLLVGWGGPHGVQSETGYDTAAGDAFQQAEHSGMIKAAAEFKGVMSFQGHDEILSTISGQSMSAPSGSAATGYTHVHEPASTGDNTLSCCISAYEGIADGAAGTIDKASVDRTARSAKANQWTIDIPKNGPMNLDVKFLADKIIPNSIVNTQSVLTALTANEAAWRYKVMGWHFTNTNTNNGYVRMAPVGAVAMTAPKCTTVAAGADGVWTIGSTTTTTGPVIPEKITLTFSSATNFDYVCNISGATGSGVSGTPFTVTQATGRTQELTFTKSGTWASADTAVAWIYYDATGTDAYDFSTKSQFGIYPNHQKYNGDWHLEGVHTQDRVISEPYSKQQPDYKVELDFDDDQGSVIDPNGILLCLKGAAAARSEGVPTTDFKLEAYGESPIYAGTGAGALRYAIKIQLPRLVPTWKDAGIAGPGPQAGKYEFKALKPFSAPDGMSGVVYPYRITIINKLSTAPTA